MFGKKDSKLSTANSSTPGKPQQNQFISTNTIRQKMVGSADIVYSEITINSDMDQRFSVIFIDGMIDSMLVDNFVLKPLVQEAALRDVKTEQKLIDLIMLGTVYHNQRKQRNKLSDCLNDLLSGSALLVFNKTKSAISFELKGFDKRGITEPTNENVLKGSKESFIEVIRTNTSMVRRRIQTSDLKINEITLGQRTHTTVSVIFLDGVANNQIVAKVKERLTSINIDGIITAGQIETFLLDNKNSFFPQILYTERVDKFCASILEGRIGILTDGLPIAYVLPVDLNSFLQAPEDYALHFLASSLFRLLRHVCAFTALILPAFYVSITTFHQEMIPTKLAISIITSKQGVPFPTYIEVILMLLAFEIMLEAGLRLPRTIGQAVSIVGAIIIGQAAISASILSPGVVIVISAAGISGFVIPSQDLSNAIRLCRLVLVLLSIIAGLFTMILGLIIILYHLCTLEIFGVPYMSPYTASEGEGLFVDSLIREPWLKAKNRPSNISPEDTKRQGG